MLGEIGGRRRRGVTGELEESICLTSDYTTKVQSSRQYGIGTKTDIYKVIS